jgi:pimeloyl-ACP methyl ester carboxylesterase
MKQFYIVIIISLLIASCSGYKYTSMPALEFEDIQYGYSVKMTTSSPAIAYIDAGSGDKTLVLVHGLASNAGFWREVIPQLEKEYRLIVVDLPGYGKSQKGELPIGIQYYADVIAGLIDELHLQNVSYVGHSMGGQIGITLSLSHPTKIENLILAAPAGIERFDRGAGNWLSSVITHEGVVKTTEENIRRNLSGNFYRWNERHEWMVEERVRMAKAYDIYDFAHAVDKSVDAMLNEPTTDRLGDIKHRTLIIYGKNDNLIPNPYLNPGKTGDVMKMGHELIPKSTLVEIDRCGHMLILEKPKEFSDAIRAFLK